MRHYLIQLLTGAPIRFMPQRSTTTSHTAVARSHPSDAQRNAGTNSSWHPGVCAGRHWAVAGAV